MAKTKRQLRAEAVERLKSTPCAWGGDYIGAILGIEYRDSIDRYELRSMLIDLLTDDEPTNGIADGINGITLPEGDALKIMRRALDNQNSPTFCALLRYLGISDGMSSTWNEAEEALRMLADMVERDYVRREHYINIGGAYERLQAERDELQRKLEILKAHGVEIVDAVAGGFEVYNEAIRERDEWKAKAEKATHDNPYVGLVRGEYHERTENSDYYCGKCGYPVTDHDSYCRECGGAFHHAHSKAEPIFSDVLTDETDVSTDCMDANDGNADSREKLEADVLNHVGLVTNRDTVFGWLDRQAVITERECREYEDAMREQHHKRVAKLTAERDNLARDLAESERLREQLREKLGIACDHAHDLLALVNLDGEVIS